MVQKVTKFSKIYQQVCDQRGGEKAVAELLPDGIASAVQLAKLPDDRYLSEITKSVFKAGFVWRVIDNKWPAFEKAFDDFDIDTCIFMSPEKIDALCEDQSIVRNRPKILTVPKNAQMIGDLAGQHGSFGKFVGEWPDDDYIGLLDYFKKHGERMGGNSCQYFLRFVGKDGYLLTDDVNRALINAGVIDKPATAKKQRTAVQQAINNWRAESGFNQAEISRILALSIGPS